MEKILIIKLGADGDVLRTLPITRAIKKIKPDSIIYWITKGDISDLINSNPDIYKVFDITDKIDEEFSIVYNFDTDKEALSLMNKIKAKKKIGFYDNDGFPAGTNKSAEYYINTIFDDNLKKDNRKTYQKMMFDIAEIDYNGEKYDIKLKNDEIKYAEKFLKDNSLNKDRLIGIHMGASSRWPSKAWAEKRIEELIKMLNYKKYDILLFGGPNEIKKQSLFCDKLRKSGLKVTNNNPNNTKREFAALVSMCKAIVCSDSFALHVSLAFDKPTIGLFFCTSPYEVEDYGKLKKIVSKKLNEFFPDKSDLYDVELTESISAQEVFDTINKIQ